MTRNLVERPRQKLGRPPKLTREAVIEAAHEIGFENLTMKTVAEHLGVSVPGLYHYVSGKDDLLRSAAELSEERMELPTDHGQHWAVWLYEWGWYNRDVFAREPGLLRQFLDGAIAADRTGERIDTAMATLLSQGFSIMEARLAYGWVSEFAVGAAIAFIREREAAANGRPTLAGWHQVLAQKDASELPHLRRLVADATVNPTDGFDEGLTTLLRGIAAIRGEDWRPIAARLRRRAQRR